MAVYKECRFYLEGNHCSHRDAPEPRYSMCIGKESCEAWQDSILDQAKSEAEIIKQARQDTASTLFETIELMYPELRSVYWKGKKWQSFKSEYLIPPNPVGSADL